MILSLSATAIAQLQELQQGLQRGATQLFAVGTDLYFVMRAQQGGAAGDPPPYNELSVWKSSDKVTWSLVATATETGPPLQDNFASDCPTVLVGTKLYILNAQIDSTGAPVDFLLFHIFDTGTDAFLADSALSDSKGSALQDSGYSVSAFNDGTLLVSFSFDNGATNDMAIQVYDPSGDSWGIATTVDSSLGSGSLVAQQVHDPDSDLAFLFYCYRGTQELRCATIDSGLGFTDVTVDTLGTGPTPAGNGVMGQPVITTDTGEVAVPYRYLPPSGPPQLKVARSAIGVTPTFSVDLVEDDATLGGAWVQGWDQMNGGAYMCLDIGGLLYAFYAVSEDLDSASSQCWLYYRWSDTPGTWSDPHIAYASVVPGEMMIPYGAELPGFDPVIVLGIMDPTLFPDISGLTNFILFPGSAILRNTFE